MYCLHLLVACFKLFDLEKRRRKVVHEAQKRFDGSHCKEEKRREKRGNSLPFSSQRAPFHICQCDSLIELYIDYD